MITILLFLAIGSFVNLFVVLSVAPKADKMLALYIISKTLYEQDTVSLHKNEIDNMAMFAIMRYDLSALHTFAFLSTRVLLWPFVILNILWFKKTEAKILLMVEGKK